MRFLPNGQLDTSFGTNGRAVTTFNSSYAIPSNMVVRPNGKIVLAGRSVNDIAIAYYNADGSPETSFDGDGKLAFNFPVGSLVIPTGVAVDNFGRVVLGGVSNENQSSPSFAAARFYSLDPVNVSGRAVTPNGVPIRSVRVGLTVAYGVTQWALTSPFGNFQFENVSPGQICNVFVRGSKTYIFEAQDINVTGAVNNVELIGTPRTETLSKAAPKR